MTASACNPTAPVAACLVTMRKALYVTKHTNHPRMTTSARNPTAPVAAKGSRCGRAAYITNTPTFHA